MLGWDNGNEMVVNNGWYLNLVWLTNTHTMLNLYAIVIRILEDFVKNRFVNTLNLKHMYALSVWVYAPVTRNSDTDGLAYV